MPPTVARVEDQVVGRDDAVDVVETAQLATAAAGQPGIGRHRHAVLREVGVGHIQVARREQVAVPAAGVAGVDRDARHDLALDADLPLPVVRTHVPAVGDRRVVVGRARRAPGRTAGLLIAPQLTSVRVACCWRPGWTDRSRRTGCRCRCRPDARSGIGAHVRVTVLTVDCTGLTARAMRVGRRPPRSGRRCALTPSCRRRRGRRRRRSAGRYPSSSARSRSRRSCAPA